MLTVEHLSKEYPPRRPAGAQRFFARLGGLQLDPTLSDLDADDDDDDDEEPRYTEIVEHPGPWDGPRTVIDDVSFVASAGSVVAVEGPPGSGKTTLLKLIGGIVPPSSGRIVVNGRVAPALNILSRSIPAKGRTLRTAIPYVMATAGLPSRLARSPFEKIADLLEVPKLGTWPTGAADGRLKQEIVLAAMLLAETEVFLTDIPTPQNAFGERFLARLEERRSAGCLVITEVRDLRKALPVPDRVLHLEHGRLATDAPHVPAPGKRPRP